VYALISTSFPQFEMIELIRTRANEKIDDDLDSEDNDDLTRRRFLNSENYKRNTKHPKRMLSREGWGQRTSG